MKHIPNILSFIRILLLPWFVKALMMDDYLLAGGVIILSGITDFLDGFLARTFQWQSRLGELLDPLADKLTQTTIALAFVFYLKDYKIFFIIILFKDVLMLLGSFIFYKKDFEIPAAKWFGKVATVLFYLTIAIVLLFPDLDVTIKKGLLSTVVLSSLFSLLMYIKLFFTNHPEVKDSIKP